MHLFRQLGPLPIGSITRDQLLNALREYPRLSNSERITFEYVMLDGVNDSDADARRLVKLIQGIPAKINLIPFNEWPGAPYKRSSWERIESFADIVHKAGYAAVHEGAVAYDGYGLFSGFRAADNVEAVSAGNGRAHADRGVDSAERGQSAERIAADVADYRGAEL